jgi:hypothetical protein
MAYLFFSNAPLPILMGENSSKQENTNRETLCLFSSALDYE